MTDENESPGSQDVKSSEDNGTEDIVRLTAEAEEVLDSLLNQAATETCDNIDLQLNFVDICNGLISSVNADSCGDHVAFFPYAIKWLNSCIKYLRDNQELLLESDLITDRVKHIFDATSCILTYIGNVLDILKFLSSVSSNKENEVETSEFQGDLHADWIDDSPYLNSCDEDDESLIDDSDNESLSNKLCTFTTTKKEFVNQHWYHCHTCNMIDVAGVCSVCAKVCHKDHDISYAKYGAFFCDCAGKEKSTCMALVKRPRVSGLKDDRYQESVHHSESLKDMDLEQPKSNNIDSASTARTSNLEMKRSDPIHQRLISQLEPIKSDLLDLLSKSDLCVPLSDLLVSITEAFTSLAKNESIIGRAKAARAALDELHSAKAGRRKKLPVKNAKTAAQASMPNFPVDFFEGLVEMNDVEFGGSDLLSIYTADQLRNRLNTSGMQVTCVKSAGFSVEVTNPDSNLVICGLRIQMGYQDLSKVPTSVELFGRSIQINPANCRWYDFPLTREESLRADRKLTITFGPSSDTHNITRIDSIKIYGKTKESFSWPDDTEDPTNPAFTSEELLSALLFQKSDSRHQRLMIQSMDILECCLRLIPTDPLGPDKRKELAKELSTSLLILPYPTQILRSVKNLLLAIHGTKQIYIQHRDSVALDFVTSGFKSFNRNDVDAELFTRVVSIIKSSSQYKLSNLTKFSECFSKVAIENDPGLSESLSTEIACIEQLISYLNDLFRQLYTQKPIAQNLASVASHSFINLTDTLQPLIELIYAATLYDLSILSVATNALIGFLLDQDLNIALCARNTLIRLLKSEVIQQEDMSVNQAVATTSDKEKIRQQHLILLERLIEHLPDTREAGGYRSISLLHVILVLALDLDCENEIDDAILKNLLHALRQELLWNTSQIDQITHRTPTNEVKLVIMRMFSILMSRVRTSSVALSMSSSTRAETDSCWSVFCSSITALSLIESNVIEFCHNVLQKLIDYWRLKASATNSSQSITISSNESSIANVKKITPKTSVQFQMSDSSPFFFKAYSKLHSTNLFDDYPQLLTEMVLKIPYQIKKVSSSSANSLKPVTFSKEWTSILCDYLMTSIPTHIMKNVRKLLTFICGSKDKYRQVRDFHFLESHLGRVKSICGLTAEESDNSGDQRSNEMEIRNLNYNSLSNLVEHLKSCIGISQSRCVNWQLYCLCKDQTLLCLLLDMSLKFNEEVSSIILELLQHAVSSSPISTSQSLNDLMEVVQISASVSSLIDDHTLKYTSDSLSANLAQQLITRLPKDSLSKFIQTFLLETNQSSVRWQAHNLICSLWSHFDQQQKLDLLSLLWSLWHNLPCYGRKASQFVDLVGYMTLRSPHKEDYDRMFCQETLDVLRQQNQLLAHHPNAHFYNSIQNLVDLDCYYLESEPCSVCNSPEVSYSSMKLSSIKVDSRFTTTTQIIKLNGSHTILRFSLRISEIKRSKMVKSINIYYNNRSVQSVVELKNKAELWNLARKQYLSPSQADVKIEFTLPIVACNLMIQFSEFFENLQASSETLQCPRCSASVSANPGVCSNCGENVFQCHKCRAINYDERDPFLCISCGFCKYARFDITLTAKPTCVVEPIENEEDRKRTVASISNLLDKADRVYKNLAQNKPYLELLLLRINDQILPDAQIESIFTSDQGSPLSMSNSLAQQGSQSECLINPNVSAINSSVSKVIQLLVQKYCAECKGLFEELSKITHMVLASRKEIVKYENKQLRRCLNSNSSMLTHADRRKSKVYSSLTCGSGKCYGCGTATVEHCITMLKALATVDRLRAQICESGIIHELVNFNLKYSSTHLSQEVKELLCLLTRDDLNSTKILIDLLMNKIATISRQDYQPHEMSHIIRHEVSLLSVSLESEDQCWELRLRCLIRIFAFAFEMKSPMVMCTLLVPCLKLLLSIVRPSSPTTRRNKDRDMDKIASVRSDKYRSRVLLQEWLNNPSPVFDDWRKRGARPSTLIQGSGKLIPIKSSILKPSTKSQSRANYLAEKYGNTWRLKSSDYDKVCEPVVSLPNDWLKQILFDKSSKTVRLMARSLVEALFSVEAHKKDIIDLLTSYLNEIGSAGECAYEFYSLYKNIILTDHWRYYLALQGILFKLSSLISQEIDNLQELEESTLNSSLSLGCSLKMMVELLTDFVALPRIMSHYKAKLVGLVLKGYLSLRKLVVQRTKVIDETQEMLLELLEGMTTGSEEETANFINVCVDAIRNCHDGDIRTPVFIFERLCSTIHPEESINNEFFVSLEKDSHQEDFLQGRMLGNPYSSNDPGIGPLMKDIKNRICQDCELLALLEDDSSMELLVSNKIISLDLTVRDVYKRIWCSENHETDPMRIIYRMRGLLGDATEEFIESLDTHGVEEVDLEQTFKIANVMSSSGGLEVILGCLKQIDDLSPPLKPLLDVVLRLLDFCTKTSVNRLRLTNPELNTVPVLLKTLKLALNEEEFLKLAGLPKWFMLQDGQQLDNSTSKVPLAPNQNSKSNVVDRILSILETLFREATKQSLEAYQEFSKTFGLIEDLKLLLGVSLTLSSRLPQISHKIIQLLPFLTLGNREKMSVLIDYFKPYLDFDRFDQQHLNQDEICIDLFCSMVDAIEHNENGNQLKDYIVSEGIVTSSLEYLTSKAPPLRSLLLATSEEWKNFTSRPALKYVLRLLAGQSEAHAVSQMLISRSCIPIVHGLEQVSSDSRVGTLAENLLEAIKEHPSVAEKIELVRRQTKEEKKRLAMAVRERQLGALGMKANERGQVIAKCKLLEQCLDLLEDSGLICNICREGYKFQPTKVLGIYTYTKRCILDEFEVRTRKTYGYSTVTHFNTVHVECHMSAVRSARGREEWESAALQNANTRCNGLLPVWGPQVPESAYANALARHNTYLQDCTGCREIGYHSTIHDIRLQLLRFAQERSFSEDTGGGGPQSNLHLLPYMMQAALYVLNSTKTATREYKRILNFLDMGPNEVLENCYEVDSPYYWTVLALLVLSPSLWRKKKVQFLQRLLVCNHVRRVSIKPSAPISDTRIRAYAYYKPAVIFFAMIDSFYEIVLKGAVKDGRWDQDWSIIFTEYLKHNDQTVNDNIEVLLSIYQNDLLNCTSIEKFFEIIRIEEVLDTSTFLADTLRSV